MLIKLQQMFPPPKHYVFSVQILIRYLRVVIIILVVIIVTKIVQVL